MRATTVDRATRVVEISIDLAHVNAGIKKRGERLGADSMDDKLIREEIRQLEEARRNLEDELHELGV